MSDSDEIDSNCDFGSLLANARKTQNYTVEAVCKQLKIPNSIINAIETNDLSQLPATTFTQGYIRNYAKFLEVSEDEVLELYNKAEPHEQIEKLRTRPRFNSGTNSRSPLIMLVTALLIISGVVTVTIAVFQYYQEKADDMGNELEAKEQVFTGNSLDSPGLTKLGIKQNARLTAEGELIVESEGSIDLSAENPDIESTSQVEAAEVTNEQVDSGNEQDKLEINAEKGSWVEVRDASNLRLFYNMLPRGGSKTLFGQAPFSVSLGNAKTTRLVINDLAVDMAEHIRSNNTVKLKVSSENQKIVID